MSVVVDLQLALDPDDPHIKELPTAADFQHWAENVLAGRREAAELTLRIVGDQESAQLNERYRHKPGATNVLSFPFESPAGISLPLLGDLVICAPRVASEAQAQHKSLTGHWAHLVIHGLLHLLGYDHSDPQQAQAMEALEIAELARLGYPNPYE